MQYRVRESIPEDAHTALGTYDSLVKKLLYYRGIRTQEEAEAFLFPQYENHTHHHEKLFGMTEAVSRIAKAIDTNETIGIYSDYDADGVPGSVIFYDFFRKIGYKNIVVYIPHRNDEGFGLNVLALDELREKGVSLVVTIDCGIADVTEVEYAQSRGMDVIITDHHLPGGNLPPAYSIVNPKHVSCTYPYGDLCGSGVIFKVVQGLLAYRDWGIKAGWEKWLLDMVGIATISDMVPLVGENRTLAHYGLKVLRKTRRPGLKALFAKNRIKPDVVTEDDIGFTISPRINAASRMGHPIDAFNMLSATTPEDAELAVNHLEKINKERKQMVVSMMKEVHKRLSEGEKKKVVVIGNPHWKPSLAGLLANKLVDEYGVPAFVWGRGGSGDIKGSCRSPIGTNVFELMSRVREGIFSNFGGHAMSGGFVLTETGVLGLEEALIDASIDPVLKDEMGIVDAYLPPEEVTFDLYNRISKLAPFGQGNPKPIFMFENVTLEGVSFFGKQKEHTEFRIKRQGYAPLKGIVFFKNDFDVSPGDTRTIVGTIEKSHFGRAPEVRVRVIDVY